MKRLLPVIPIIFTACHTGAVPAPQADGDWTAYGRDAFGSRHSPLTQITPENVGRLEVAWTYHTHEPLPTADRKRSL